MTPTETPAVRLAQLVLQESWQGTPLQQLARAVIALSDSLAERPTENELLQTLRLANAQIDELSARAEKAQARLKGVVYACSWCGSLVNKDHSCTARRLRNAGTYGHEPNCPIRTGATP